jgi:hypothetical protein
MRLEVTINRLKNVMMNVAKDGIKQLWVIISTLGSCWSISKRPNEEKLKEVYIV